MLLDMSGRGVGITTGAEFDLVVIGAGPAGSAVAITVARTGARVLLLDPILDRNSDHNNDQSFKVGESLPPAANPILQALGVTRQFLAAKHSLSCGVQSSWGSPRLRNSDFIRDPRGHGWHLDRLKFDAMLRSLALAQGTQIEIPARVIRAERTSEAVWEITYRNDAESRAVRTRWVADCTGRQSWFARQQGAQRIHDDRLVAFVGIFSLAELYRTEPSNTATLIESVPHGWWYTAALPGGRRVVVYLTDADSEQVKRACTKAGFLSLLAETHHVAPSVEHYRTSEVALQAARANSSRLDRCWGPGWVAAGDASMSFDPLSSQGIFNALYSGTKAGQALQHGIRGDLSLLSSYEERLRKIYSIYLSGRNVYYGLERRWPSSRFWQRRRSEYAVA